MKALYSRHGFRVTSLKMDLEFGYLQGEFTDMGIHMNTASEHENVPQIERQIRTIKEPLRCDFQASIFECLPPLMTIDMVQRNVMWLGSLPPKDGISKTHSPWQLIVGTKLDFNIHRKLEFGPYVQVHEQGDNIIVTRATVAIVLQPTRNAQGGNFFFSLRTGQNIDQKKGLSSQQRLK